MFSRMAVKEMGPGPQFFFWYLWQFNSTEGSAGLIQSVSSSGNPLVSVTTRPITKSPCQRRPLNPQCSWRGCILHMQA